MKFSIIPITYLICLSIILTPIAGFVFFQIFKFNRDLLILKINQQSENQSHINIKEIYNIANLYINNQIWHIALTRLENHIYNDKMLNKNWAAKYYNAIGFILHKLDYYTLAKKYYIKSSESDSTYIYAQKNIESLPCE